MHLYEVCFLTTMLRWGIFVILEIFVDIILLLDFILIYLLLNAILTLMFRDRQFPVRKSKDGIFSLLCHFIFSNDDEC
jgi:hypothetical protein